jgi:hypothetical protein
VRYAGLAACEGDYEQVRALDTRLEHTRPHLLPEPEALTR